MSLTRNKLNKCWRTVKVDMIPLLENIENVYLTDLDQSINILDNYEDVSIKTFDDYLLVLGKVRLLFEIGLIDFEECEAIKSIFEATRLDKLRTLEEQGEGKDG